MSLHNALLVRKKKLFAFLYKNIFFYLTMRMPLSNRKCTVDFFSVSKFSISVKRKRSMGMQGLDHFMAVPRFYYIFYSMRVFQKVFSFKRFSVFVYVLTNVKETKICFVHSGQNIIFNSFYNNFISMDMNKMSWRSLLKVFY